MKKVILISGGQGAGKTTLCRILRQEFETRNNRTASFKFAQPLYDMHHAVHKVLRSYGIDREHQGTDGVLLQVLGTEWGRRVLGNNVWVRALLNTVEMYWALNPSTMIFIDDVRFPNELHAFDKYPDVNVVSIRLECDKGVRQARAEKWRPNESHQSERALDEHKGKFTYTFDSGANSAASIAQEVYRCLSKIQS